MTAESAARSFSSSSAPWKTEFDELWQFRHSFVLSTVWTDAKPVLSVGPVPPSSSLHATAPMVRPAMRIVANARLMGLSNRNKADMLTTATAVGKRTDRAKLRTPQHVVHQRFSCELGFNPSGLSQ